MTTINSTKYLLKSIQSVSKTYLDVPQISEADYPEESYKFASWNYAYDNTNDYVRAVLDRMPVVGDHKNILVDIKVHELVPGQIPALPHWHFDCVGDPRHPAQEERHHLFVTKGSLTEFLQHDLEFELPEPNSKYLLNHSCFRELRGVRVKPTIIYTYGRHLHKASPSYTKGKRLLVRVSETDIIKPQNKKFKVTYR